MEKHPEFTNVSATEPTSPASAAGPSTSSDFRRITRSVTSYKRETVPSSSGTQTGNKSAKRKRKERAPAQDKVPVSDGEEISAQEAVFSNHLLLREIFKHLSFLQLKSCRQISTLCNFESTTMLLNRFETKPITLCDKKAQLQRPSITQSNLHPSTNQVPLEEFFNLVSRSRIFSCNKLVLYWTFFYGDNYLNFFTKHGSIIKSLAYEEGRIDQVISFVAKYLPNLETLTYSGQKGRYHVCLGGDENPDLDETLDHPKLRVLKMDALQQQSAIFISKMLRVAKNLKQIYFKYTNFYMTGLKDFVKANAIPKLVDINILFNHESCELFEQIMNQNPRFEIIRAVTIEPSISSRDLPRVGEILSKMFEQCKDSLTSISAMCCLGSIPDLRIPVLPNLNELSVNFAELKLQNEDPIWNHALPDGLDAEKLFPQLKKLEVFYGVTNALKIFPESTKFLSLVDTLVLSADKFRVVPTSVVEELQDMSYFISSASFPLISDEAFQFVFDYEELTSLEITVRTGEDIETFPSLDSILTGFSHETVRRLHGERIRSFEVGKVNAKRIKRSLQHLSELRKLVIKLEDTRTLTLNESDSEGTLISLTPTESGSDLLVGNKILFSHVAVIFAINWCDNLCISDVKILWENKQVLGNKTVIKRNYLSFS